MSLEKIQALKYCLNLEQVAVHFILQTMKARQGDDLSLQWTDFKKSQEWKKIEKYFSEVGVREFRGLWIETQNQVEIEGLKTD